MSREIKFRAWSISDKNMIYRVIVGNTLTDDPCSQVWDEERKYWVNFDKHCGHIMQFTGIKDVKGNDVYEGDIIQQTNNKGDGKGSFEFIGVVEYDGLGFCKRCLKGGEIGSLYAFSYYDGDKLQKGEIIGNIYQHFKILENKDDA